jgi:predicted metal-dependent hydrolase
VARFATRLADIGPVEHIGFVFDPFQAVEAGANPFMMLAAMGNRVVNVHISDAKDADPSLRHLPPGDGDLPWSALLRAIAGSGYRGPLMIEGPLGTDDRTMTRIRETFDPLFRNVFAFPPEGEEDGGVRATLPMGVRKGIDLFNARQFYEQHEEIEHEWHAERGPLRRLYQGVLQIGVGFHHALNGNYSGSVLLLTQGIEKVESFTPEALGIDTRRLVRESRAALEQIIALGEDGIAGFDEASIPTISVRSEPE